MSQQTNLNVAPYFDDFNPDNDYHRVLFKPGYPVQARELTTLQSILQNQIERFGQHFFKEGAKVIPGNTGYNALYYAIQLQNNYLGVPVEAYIEQLVGAKITGQTSGVTAVVDNVSRMSFYFWFRDSIGKSLSKVVCSIIYYGRDAGISIIYNKS